MSYKPRTKSNGLKTLELLTKRINLSKKDHQHYSNLKKGYEGEVLFDTITEKLQFECLILNDLLLEINNTTFQIDSLLIAPGKIHFYEVKNYEGDYYYDADKLFKKPKIEVINPLHQLSRSESLLRQLLLRLGCNLPIEASVVFINPNFTLYHAPLDKPIILPTKVNRYTNQLNANSGKLTEKHLKLADSLLSLHKADSLYNQIPAYEYEQLRKGIICPKCHSFSYLPEKRKCVCHKCGYEELVTNAVLRSVEEYKILFPNEKITTNIIHDWCQVVQSKQRIRKILASNYSIVGVHQWAYYI